MNRKTFLVLCFFIMIIGLTGCGTSQPSQTNEKEKKYQEGLSFIEQKNWEQASFTFYFMCGDKNYPEYKDSKALYNYTTAQTKYQESKKSDAKDPLMSAMMADYYCKFIPDTYSGTLKDEILKFKDETKNYLAALENDATAKKKHKIVLQQEKKEEQAKAEAEKAKYAPQKIVDSNGKQIWKIHISTGKLHFTGTYKGTGNFIVKLSNSNQDLVNLIANEIGDYVADKTVSVPYDGWYYLEINTTDGSSNFRWE